MRITQTLTTITTILLLSGCTTFGVGGLFKGKPKEVPVIPEVKIVTEEVPMNIYHPPLPQEIKLQDVEFFVISERNLDEQIKKIEKLLDGGFVVFALIPQDYEAMAFNLQEIKRYILQQKDIILYYRSVTQNDDVDGDGDTDLEDWKARNKDITKKFKEK